MDEKENTEHNWRYECFYFGSSGWPSDAIWRVDGDVREFWVDHPILLPSKEAAQKLYDENKSKETREPSAKQYLDRNGQWSVGWWYRYSDKAVEEQEYARDRKDGWGDPSELQPDSDSTPLRAMNII